MRPLPPRSTRTDPLFPYPTLFRSVVDRAGSNDLAGVIQGSIEFSFRAPRAACAATRHRWAQLSHEPDTCQAQVRQPQRHEAAVGILLQPAVACLGKALQRFTTENSCSTRARIFDLLRFRLCSRSEEHTSELQSLMRISYAVFCLTKKNNQQQT